jgi:aryl-alcohol dehydrogenase-like predicted oxidoreductase
MDWIALPDGRRTTQLGFGCAQISSGISKGASIRLVHAALDAGITHFDTAPSYGMGMADDALGSALAGRRNGVTITTKVGLGRPTARGALGLARATLRPLLALTPGLRARLGRAAYAATTSRSQFGLAQVRASLEESLMRLGTDRVDLLLLHQATAADITDELLGFLDKRRRAGMVGSFGVGTTLADAQAIAIAYPQLAGVLQTSWSALDPLFDALSDRLHITHGTLRALPDLRAALARNPTRRERLEQACGAPLSSPRELAAALLAAARANNAGGIVLVSTREPERMAENAAVFGDDRALEIGRRLALALRAEGAD